MYGAGSVSKVRVAVINEMEYMHRISFGIAGAQSNGSWVIGFVLGKESADLVMF